MFANSCRPTGVPSILAGSDSGLKDGGIVSEPTIHADGCRWALDTTRSPLTMQASNKSKPWGRLDKLPHSASIYYDLRMPLMGSSRGWRLDWMKGSTRLCRDTRE